MTRYMICPLLFVALSVGPAGASITFYDNDAAGFNAAVSSYTHIGTEDFEESTLSGGNAAAFAGPLSQTSTTPPYPSGIVQPIVVDVNGTGSLAAFRDHQHFVSTVVIANAGGDTLDWLFEASQEIIAVGFTPVTFSSINQTRDLEVAVYDTSNTLLDMITIDSNPAGSFHLGIVAAGSSRIGRINLRGYDGAGEYSEGGDNVALYSHPVPEPTAGLLAMAGMLWLAARRRR